MEMTGEHRIPAPRERVWAFLNDPEVLKACIPGCQSLEGSPEEGFSATVRIKIGPVAANFKGKVTLEDVDPPAGYTIAGEGAGGVAGFAKGRAVVRLAEEGAATIISYSVEASVGGKIAQLGGRLIDSTAKKLAEQFFNAFVRIASEDPAGALEQSRTGT